MRGQKDWIKSISWQTNLLIFSLVIFLYGVELLERREEVQDSLFEKSKGCKPLGVGMRKREARPLFCLSIEGERKGA